MVVVVCAGWGGVAPVVVWVCRLQHLEEVEARQLDVLLHLRLGLVVCDDVGLVDDLVRDELSTHGVNSQTTHEHHTGDGWWSRRGGVVVEEGCAPPRARPPSSRCQARPRRTPRAAAPAGPPPPRR